MKELEQLLWKLKADPRWERFQSLIVNLDGSVLVTHRHGSKYFPSFAALEMFLNEPGQPEETPKGES